MHSLFTAPGRSGHGRSARFKAPTRGGKVRSNWTSINQLAAGLTGQAAGLQDLRGHLEALKFIARYLDSLHPFKLYQVPAVLRTAPDPSADWRKFLVRAGRVLESDATGTDAVDHNPDSETYPTSPTEITVPEDTDDYWFWLEIDTTASPTTAVVRSGTLTEAIAGSSGGSEWPDAPKPDTEHVPIGMVNTQTSAATQTPVVRQYLRQDIAYLGGSSGGATRFRVKSVQGDYLTCRTWDGTTEGEENVLVAKPPQLRHSITAQTIDGASVTYADYSITGGVCKRVASAADEEDQNEMVIPVYQLAGNSVDAEIWADQPKGGTGAKDGDQEPIDWQDTNRDARAWCHLSSETLSSS